VFSVWRLFPVHAPHHADVSILAFFCLALLFPAQTLGASTVQRDFDEANTLKDGDACNEAIARYSEVLAAAEPTSRIHALALYNQAVCFETTGDLAQAKFSYDLLLTREDPEASALHSDVRFRRGLVLIAGGQLRAARKDLVTVRRQTSDAMARARVDVQIAWIDVGSGHLARASQRLKRAVELLNQAGNQDAPDAYFLAQALCALGDVFVAEASRVPIHRKNPGRTVDALEKRAALIARAQAYYVAAIDQHVPTWAAAATLHLGRGFQSAADELWKLSNAQAPSTHKRAAQHLAMQHWIRKRIPMLLRKSFEAYSVCQSLGYETGDISRFTRACSEALESFPTERLTSSHDS